MQGKKRRKPGRFRPPLRRIAALLFFAVTLPAALIVMSRRVPPLWESLKSAALLSAALAMPDGGIELLKERFRADLFGEETHSPPQQALPPGAPAPAPSPPPPIDVPPQGLPSVPPVPHADPPAPARQTERIPRIPSAYAAPILSENFAGSDGGTLIRYEAGYIKNDTTYSNGEIEEMLEKPSGLRFERDGSPQVLIMHTHATESFETYDHDVYDTRNTWRSTDNHNNMVAVGDALRQVLESYGVGVLHDTTQHDHPSYNGSYERSAETIRRYLEEYPGIKVVLDVHRDAMARDDTIVKPVSVINGRKAAQIMIISGCDDGSMNMPDWRENLRFAAAFQSYLEQTAPELTRPVYLAYRKYNQDLTTGSLLLEFGSNANTLEEASYAAELAGHALARLIGDYSDPVA